MYPSNPLEMSSFVAFYTIKSVDNAHLYINSFITGSPHFQTLSAGAAPCRELRTQATVFCQSLTEGGTKCNTAIMERLLQTLYLFL